MNALHISYFVKRDWDGFFGLFVDNLVQLLLIVNLCGICGIAADSDLMVRSILPGAALSIVIGNLFYAWQALQLARKEQRDDVTALPYGINTPSLLVYVFFVMVPVYQRTNSPEQAWKMGLLACLGSGIIEFIGSFVAEGIRRRTPRAALLSTLAGIAIGFIAMTFALQIFQRPLIAMLPLAIVLVTYFSHVPFPGGLPGGLVAVVMGTLCGWLLPLVLPVSLAGPPMSVAALAESWGSRGWYFPQLAVVELFDVLRQPGEWIGFLSVIVPMGLFNVIGSLQNIESAEAAGDRYHTQSSLAVNGLGTILAACFGSCFPTTIYIGHPGWKQLGARAGYSTLNGLAIVLICLTGTVGFISRLIPLEAGIAIVLWIGIIITAQAFQTTPIQHAPAVAVGLFPAIAAWGATVTHGAFIAIGLRAPAVPTMQMLLNEDLAFTVNGFLLHGLLLMERGYIFSCMLLAAICAFLIDRRFNAAAIWSLVAALFAAVGLTHAYQLSGNTYDYLFVFQEPVANATAMRAHGIAVGYLLFALFFFIMGRYQSSRGDAPLSVGHS